MGLVRLIVLLVLLILAIIFLTVSRAENQTRPSLALPEYVCKSAESYALKVCLIALEGEGGGPLIGRTPLIFIHGWNSKEIPGEGDVTVWRGLVKHLNQSRWFREKYKLYFLIYPSNTQTIRELGLDFAYLIGQMDQADPEFKNRPMVIIGYSMGGLVARSYIQEPRLGSGSPGGERILRLITLGTPHHGTPIANGPARDNKAGGLAGLLLRLDGGFFNKDLTWSTDNRFDLHWDNYDNLLDYGRYPESNLWLERLNSGETFKGKIIAYAGTVKPFTQLDDCYFSFFQEAGCLAGIMNSALGVPESDGVVPLTSALFYPCNDCLGTRIYPGYDHGEIVGGKLNDWFPFPLVNDNDPIFWDIAGNLLSLVMPQSAGFDNYVDLGNPDDERFHNLVGWNKINSGLLPRPDTDRTSRYQTVRGQSSVDLSVPNPGGPHRLTFRSEAGYCDDSFAVYMNNYLVYTYVHNMKPDFPIHSTQIFGDFVKSSRTRIVFENTAKDSCGSAAIYYVRLDPM